MDILIKNATILHQGSMYHLQKRDIYISDGRIQSISESIVKDNVKTISGSSLYCCIGLFDIGTQSGEPGFEHRETIQSLTKCARAGGYTALAVFPNNKPVTQTKADIRYISGHQDCNGVRIHPIGALSKDTKGVDIAEFVDMKAGGAVAFSDGLKPVQDTGLLNRALQYASHTDAPVIHHPDDHFLSAGGEMHEGFVSTSMGLKGVPDISELHMIQRDMLLLEYTGARLIEHALSARRSVEALRAAKKIQSGISATVAYMNLIFVDSNLADFDTNFKVLPVLRTENDRERLIEGILDGTIDAIISNHIPLDEEVKNLEFSYALPGANGIETCLPACLTYLSEKIDIALLIHKLTIAPRQLMGISIPALEEGAMADLCVFDAGEEYIPLPETSNSKSKNNPFHHIPLKGTIKATIIGKSVFL